MWFLFNLGVLSACRGACVSTREVVAMNSDIFNWLIYVLTSYACEVGTVILLTGHAVDI